MNNIRIAMSVASLSQLNPVGPNTYNVFVYFLNSLGAPISDPNIPASPYIATVTTTSTNFIVNVPISDDTFSIPNTTVKVFGNEDNNDCCYAQATTDLNNCGLVIQTTFHQCNGVVGITLAGQTDPVVISVKSSSDSTERFNERSGNLIFITPDYGAARTYEIKATDASGCISSTYFDMTCTQPNFSYEYTNMYCSGSTVMPGVLRVFATSNATRYKICYNNSACFTNCSTSDGSINPVGDTLISISPGTSGSSTTITVRIYNGTGCELYNDLTISSIQTPTCGTPCPPDGTWTQNSEGTWYKVLASSPTASPSGYAIVSKRDAVYAADGSRLYNTALSSFVLLTSSPLWKATSSTTGPMNRCSVWTNKQDTAFPINYLPVNSWIGFTHCLTGLTVGKTYYVGMEADNSFRLLVDSKIVFSVLTNDTHFRTWKIIPVVAKKTSMLIAMEALNLERVAAFGCEIYDNTYSEIQAATVIGDLNIIFTSQSKIGGVFTIGPNSGGIQYGYACPDGYVYNSCAGACQQVLYYTC